MFLIDCNVAEARTPISFDVCLVSSFHLIDKLEVAKQQLRANTSRPVQLSSASIVLRAQMPDPSCASDKSNMFIGAVGQTSSQICLDLKALSTS
jgi:hypothetical protein